MELLFSQISSLWVIPILTNINVFIDSLVYSLAEYTYKLFELASAVNLSNFPNATNMLNALRDRVTAFVTVFMLFRIVLIFVNYLMNPEKLTDKSVGGTKIISNVVVVLLLLTLVYSGFLFGILGDFQTIMFTSQYQKEATYLKLPESIFPSANNKNVIASFITGQDQLTVNYGRSITSAMLSSFLYLTEDVGTDEAGNKLSRPMSWGEKKLPKGDGSYDCGSNHNEALLCKIAYLESGTFLELTLLDTFDARLEYYPFISTIAGIFLIFSFFRFVSEVLVRALKLFLMEIISPIAIVSYIDPDKGQTIFKNYWKTYFKIYLDLFIRIALIYLSVIIIDIGTQIFTPGVGDDTSSIFNSSVGGFTLLLLKAFFIFAVLKFIKNAPELISDVFGVKFDDKNKGAFGKMLRGAAGLGIGAGIGISSARRAGLGGGQAALQGITGAYSGAKSGSSSRNMGEFISGQVANNGKVKTRSNNVAEAGGFRNLYTGKTNRMNDALESSKRYDQNLDEVLKSNSSEFASSYNPSTGHSWGSEQDHINNNSAVRAARQQEEEYMKVLGEDAFNKDGTLNSEFSKDMKELTQRKMNAENNAASEYRNATNIYLKDAFDGTRSGSSTNLAIEKLKRENPSSSNEVKFDSSGKNNISEIKKQNANYRASIDKKLKSEEQYQRKSNYQDRTRRDL